VAFSRSIVSCFFMVSFFMAGAACSSEPVSSLKEGAAPQVQDDSRELPPELLAITDRNGVSVRFDIEERVEKEGIVVLEWFNQSCPFVQKLYKNGFMQSLQKEFRDKGVAWYVVSSTNPSHKDFLSIQKRKELIEDWSLDADSLLFDEAGSLGAHYKARTTPHIFIFNDGNLVYHGAVDDAPDTDSKPEDARNFVKETLSELLAGQEPSINKSRPYGCSIKYAK
jgi:thioredoxin-related protein